MHPPANHTPSPTLDVLSNEYRLAAAEEGRHWGEVYRRRLSRGVTHTVDLSAAPSSHVTREGWGDDRRLLEIIEGDILASLLQASVRGQRAVVELGCGAGALSLELARRGASVVGLDLSFDALSIARDYVRALPETNRLRISHAVSDLNAFELAKQSCDAVVAHSSLHHVVNLDGLMATISRALRPGGRFVLYDNIGETHLSRLIGRFEDSLCRAWRLVSRVVALPFYPSWSIGYFRSVLQRRSSPSAAPFHPTAPSHSPFELVSTDAIPIVFDKYFERMEMRESQAFVKRFAGIGVAESIPGWLLYPTIRLLKGIDSALIRIGVSRGENVLLIGRSRFTGDE